MAQLITGIKTPEQLEAMREGGKRLAQIFADIRQFVHAGVSEKQIDAFAAERIAAYGAEPTYKTPEVNFPGVICISTNEATSMAYQAIISCSGAMSLVSTLSLPTAE